MQAQPPLFPVLPLFPVFPVLPLFPLFPLLPLFPPPLRQWPAAQPRLVAPRCPRSRLSHRPHLRPRRRR